MAAKTVKKKAVKKKTVNKKVIIKKSAKIKKPVKRKKQKSIFRDKLNEIIAFALLSIIIAIAVGLIYANYKVGNIPDDVKTEYWKGSTVRAKIPMKDGVQHGLVKWYYPSGKLQIEQEIKKGRAHGDFKFYYETGKLQSEGTLKNNQRHGTFISYDEEGKVVLKQKWRNGKLTK